MATIELGNKTMTDHTGVEHKIEVIRVVVNPNAQGVDSVIYKKQNFGSPRQEYSVSATVYAEQGWS